jgi:hypothetical protein
VSHRSPCTGFPSSLTLVHFSRSFTASILFFGCARLSPASRAGLFKLYPPGGRIPQGPIAAGHFKIWLHFLSPAQQPCPCFAHPHSSSISATSDTVNLPGTFTAPALRRVSPRALHLNSVALGFPICESEGVSRRIFSPPQGKDPILHCRFWTA